MGMGQNEWDVSERRLTTSSALTSYSYVQSMNKQRVHVLRTAAILVQLERHVGVARPGIHLVRAVTVFCSSIRKNVAC